MVYNVNITQHIPQSCQAAAYLTYTLGETGTAHPQGTATKKGSNNGKDYNIP